MSSKKIQYAFFYIAAFIILSPLFALVLESVKTGDDTFDFLMRNVLDDVFLNSLLLVVLTGVGVLLIGISCAWINVHYLYWGRGMLQWMLFMPLAFPAYILAYVYTDVFDAAGSLAIALRGAGLAWLLPDIRSIWGASFILTFCLYPYVYLFACNGFAAGSKSQMESGKLLSAGWFSRFFDIALPAARPFIVVGLMLVIMEVLADYGTVDYFGIKVFSTVIYDSWAGYGDVVAAARLALILLAFVLLLVWAEKNQRRKMRFYALGGVSKVHEPTSKGHVLMTLWCALPVLIGFVVPAILLLHMVVQTFDLSMVMQTIPYLLNTLTVCFIVAVIGVFVSFVLATQKREAPSKVSEMFFNLCGFGYALPGIILGLGLLLVSSLFIQLNLLVTGTFIFLVFGYLIRFLNVSLQSIEAGYEKINPSIGQASKLMQHSKFDDLWQVKLPLLWPSMLSAGLILSVEVIKELPLTLVLRPFDFDTLAVRTYNLASDERLVDAAFPALCIVLAGCIPVLLLHKLTRSPH